jgi:DinB superfamily
MVSGPSLKQQLDQKLQEIKQAVSGISEEKASKRPSEGEWSVNEVLSHLSGGDGDDFGILKRVTQEDTPVVEFEIGYRTTKAARRCQWASSHRRSSQLTVRWGNFSRI